MNNDNSFLQHSKCYIANSSIHGRGVFANCDLKQGDLIERCAIIPLSHRSKYHSDKVIWKYCYTKPYCECHDCKYHGFVFYMVLGLGMLYNHQDDNNAEMKFDHTNLFVDIIARRNIDKNSEIFVNYGDSYFKYSEKKTLK